MSRPVWAAPLFAVLLAIGSPLASRQEPPSDAPAEVPAIPDPDPDRWSTDFLREENFDPLSVVRVQPAEGPVPRGRNHISGVVVDPTGARIAGASVTSTLFHRALPGAPDASDTTLEARTRTNRRGLYQTAIMVPVELRDHGSLEGAIVMEAAGFEPLRIAIPSAKHPQLDVGAVLRPAGSLPISSDGQHVNVLLAGTVRDGKGRAVANARIRVLEPSESRSITVRTDRSGRYETLLLQSALTRTFELSKPGHEVARFTLTLPRVAHPQHLARGTYDFVFERDAVVGVHSGDGP